MKRHVCPPSMNWMLDNWVRRIYQNPKRILKPYVKPGMTALDVGCGPGFFTETLSELVGKNGRVIAVDIQQEMLNIVKEKQLKNVTIHKSGKYLNVKTKIDFALAFYVVHELPDTIGFFKELKSIMKPRAKLLLAEPKFHVKKKEFEEQLRIAKVIGFKERKKCIFASRARLLSQ